MNNWGGFNHRRWGLRLRAVLGHWRVCGHDSPSMAPVLQASVASLATRTTPVLWFVLEFVFSLIETNDSANGSQVTLPTRVLNLCFYLSTYLSCAHPDSGWLLSAPNRRAQAILATTPCQATDSDLKSKPQRTNLKISFKPACQLEMPHTLQMMRVVLIHPK